MEKKVYLDYKAVSKLSREELLNIVKTSQITLIGLKAVEVWRQKLKK